MADTGAEDGPTVKSSLGGLPANHVEPGSRRPSRTGGAEAPIVVETIGVLSGVGIPISTRASRLESWLGFDLSKAR